jgi:hypothetical protein
MTDDEFLKLLRAAPKSQQQKVLLIATTIVEYRRHKKAAKQRERIEKYHRDFIATINKIMGGEN